MENIDTNNLPVVRRTIRTRCPRKSNEKIKRGNDETANSATTPATTPKILRGKVKIIDLRYGTMEDYYNFKRSCVAAMFGVFKDEYFDPEKQCYVQQFLVYNTEVEAKTARLAEKQPFDYRSFHEFTMFGGVIKLFKHEDDKKLVSNEEMKMFLESIKQKGRNQGVQDLGDIAIKEEDDKAIKDEDDKAIKDEDDILIKKEDEQFY